MKYEDDAKVDGWFRVYLDTGDLEVRDRIVSHHRWIAERSVRRFSDRGESVDDLMQVAQIGIVKAVERFDPDRGFGFPAFATPTVMGELRRHFRDAAWHMSVPRRAKDLITGMNATISALTQELGRPPTVSDVARSMAISEDLVLETMEAARCYRTSSLDDSRPETAAAYERIGSEDPDLSVVGLRVTAHDAIRHLDERSQRIILWRFFEGLTQAEIGERLGVGQVHVSRLMRAALSTLRTYLEELDTPEPESSSQVGSESTAGSRIS